MKIKYFNEKTYIIVDDDELKDIQDDLEMVDTQSWLYPASKILLKYRKFKKS